MKATIQRIDLEEIKELKIIAFIKAVSDIVCHDKLVYGNMLILQLTRKDNLPSFIITICTHNLCYHGVPNILIINPGSSSQAVYNLGTAKISIEQLSSFGKNKKVAVL